MLVLKTSKAIGAFTLDGTEHEIRKPAVRATIGLGAHLQTIASESRAADRAKESGEEWAPSPAWADAVIAVVLAACPTLTQADLEGLEAEAFFALFAHVNKALESAGASADAVPLSGAPSA